MGAEGHADVTSISMRARDSSLDPYSNGIPATGSLPDSRLDFLATHSVAILQAHLKALSMQMSAVLMNAN